MPGKRTRAGASAASSKKQRTLTNEEKPKTKKESKPANNNADDELAYVQQVHGKIATAENAARVDENPPLGQLQSAIAEHKNDMKSPGKGESVVYWMRMEDMRLKDNRALFAASEAAKELGVPLVALFVLSPDDYVSHDRSPRRIDFCLRNLALLKDEFNQLNIPLYVTSHSPRKTLPEEIINIVRRWDARRLYANIEYQVDELRRDICVVHLAGHADIRVDFVSDRCVVEPGVLASKEGKQYTIYAPWWKNWVATLTRETWRLEESPTPAANNRSVREHPIFSKLFNSEVPESVPGFECHDRSKMIELWPAGAEAAEQILDRFLRTGARRSQLADASPLSDGAGRHFKRSRVHVYTNERDHADADTTSRLSPYLASGVISGRACVRVAMKLAGASRIDVDRKTGAMMWISQVAWRDFYIHVMAAFPRVSMGRPFYEKYADVKWETNAAHLKAWREGKTGVPIVDAAVRQANTQGWMHNRPRLIAGVYLAKDLMLDWRLGEKHFMEQFIDGDLASNNGGWQWCASTGVDPQPYFKVFNPYSQSEKADPSGDYIRHFVPELKNVRGKAIHDPYTHLDEETFKQLGYPEPLVNHKEARLRALRRYKNPGDK